MCGICAYAFFNCSKTLGEVFHVLISGLKHLEYRGYDSAGLCIDGTDGKPTVVKRVGNVARLQSAIDEFSASLPSLDQAAPAGVSIAHSRWATHGEVVERNAHPHWSPNKEFIVVHNGIMTNFSETRKLLESKGFQFETQTDTEVIACLAKYLYDQHTAEGRTPTFEQIINQVTFLTEGAFAVVFKSVHYPNELVACRRGSPLIVGVKKKETPPASTDDLSESVLPVEYFVASDIAAIVGHTSNVVYVADDELLVIRDGKMRFAPRKKTGSLLHEERAVTTLQMSIEQYSKGPYKYFMEKEIFDQPTTLLEAMRGRINFEACEVKLGGFTGKLHFLQVARRIIFIACGTSLHSCLAVRPTFDELTHVAICVENASDFLDRRPAVFRDDVCIFVSQSGETADTLRALEYCKEGGALLVGVTNVVGSPISRLTEFGVHLNVGAEVGVASTKSFTGQVVVMTLLALLLCEDSVRLAERRRTITRALGALPGQIAQMLPELNTQMRATAERLMNAKSIIVLGRGFQYASSLEGALKIKEIAYIHSEGINSGELKHGPLALIDENMPVISFCTQDSISDRVRVAIQQICARKARPITILSQPDPEIEAISGEVIYVPETVDCLQSVINAIPLQLLAFHAAVLRGNNVDCPRNIAKCVTVQ